MNRATVRELLERKAPRMQTKMGEEWRLHYALFAREGFTEAARELAGEHKVLLIDAKQIDADLQRAGQVDLGT